MARVAAGRPVTGEGRAANAAFLIIVILMMLVILAPFAYVVSMSLSNPLAVLQGDVWLWPNGLSLQAYQVIFSTSGFLQAYYNTMWYTVVGTAINVVMTVLAAYPLSRRNFIARRFITTMIVVTLFFQGGIIPMYVLIQHLGLYDTRWVMVLPSACSAFLIIVTRTFFETTIPEAVIEAARVDGANDLTILWRIVLPMSKPILAVLALFYAVAHWEDYFTPLVYLTDQKLQPLTIFLSNVLLQNNQALMGNVDIANTTTASALSIQLKFAMIVATIVPIVCVYPFLQKHFVKGMLIGSVKQ